MASARPRKEATGSMDHRHHRQSLIPVLALLLAWQSGTAAAGQSQTPFRHAPPLDYAGGSESYYRNPDTPLPAQHRWEFQPVDSGQTPDYGQVFQFQSGVPYAHAAETRHSVRMLSLNPQGRNDLIPAVFDSVTGQVRTLSPIARRFCDGRWRVGRLESIGNHAPAGAPGDPPDWNWVPTFKVWLSQQRAGKSPRQTTASGVIDANGEWAIAPVDCDETDAAPRKGRLDPIPATALSYLYPAGAPRQYPSPLRMAQVMGQPGLRDVRGRWVTPRPFRDVTTAQWLAIRRQGSISPGSTGNGVIDARGRMVIPFLFDQLSPVKPNLRITLCYARQCSEQKLQGRGINPHLKPVLQDGKWGYQDRQGHWVIAPQFWQAGEFRHGYAVVNGDFPHQWRPPGQAGTRPVLQGFHRIGRHWVAGVITLDDAPSSYRGRIGVMDDQGHWLHPVPIAPLPIVVPFPPGGRSEFFAKTFAKELPAVLGREVQVEYLPQPTVEDYRRFADGERGQDQVLLAAVRLPRGGMAGVHARHPIDAPLRRLAPVTVVAADPLVLLIDQPRADALGIKDLHDLLRYARRHPGKLRMGSGEHGSTGYLAAGLFKAMTHVDIALVPLPGMTPRPEQMHEGDVDLLWTPVHLARRALRGGQVLALGTSADPDQPQIIDARALPVLADTPLLENFRAHDYFSLWAPNGAPLGNINELQQAIAQVLSVPRIDALLTENQAVGGGQPPARLEALEYEEALRWKQAGSRPR